MDWKLQTALVGLPLHLPFPYAIRKTVVQEFLPYIEQNPVKSTMTKDGERSDQ